MTLNTELSLEKKPVSLGTTMLIWNTSFLGLIREEKVWQLGC